MAAGAPETPVEPCGNCQTPQKVTDAYCGRCGVRIAPEQTYRHYHAGNRPTLDQIEGNWEEYRGSV